MDLITNKIRRIIQRFLPWFPFPPPNNKEDTEDEVDKETPKETHETIALQDDPSEAENRKDEDKKWKFSEEARDGHHCNYSVCNDCGNLASQHKGMHDDQDHKPYNQTFVSYSWIYEPL